MSRKRIEESNNPRVLIIGATSPVGRRLVHRLSGRGLPVVAFSRSATERLSALGVETISGDVTALDQLATAADRCTHIVNCACSYETATAEQVNVGGARNVAIAASRAGVARALHISTLSVYPKTLARRHIEDHPYEPVFGMYQATKQAGERAFRETCGHLSVPWTCIRPGAMFGPESYWSAVGASGLPWYFGEGEGTMFAIHIQDVVDLCERALFHPSAANEVFNCVLDPPPSWRAFRSAHVGIPGAKATLSRMAAPLARYLSLAGTLLPRLRGGRLRYWYTHLRSRETWSTDKAARLLSWRATTSVSQGAAEYESWLRDRERTSARGARQSA